MSWQATRWARDQKTGSATAKAVLLIIAEQADDDGYCFLGQAAIADRAELSRRAVVNQMAALQSGGFIRRDRRVSSLGHRTSDHIQLALDGVVEGVAPPAPPPLGEADALGRALLSARDAPRDDVQGASAALGQGVLSERDARGQPTQGAPDAPKQPAKVNLTTCQGALGSHEKVREKKKPIERASKAVPKTETTIPDNFPDQQAVEKEQAYLRSKRFNIDAALEAEKFRSRNLAKGGRYKDWRAAFHTWIINAIGYAPASARAAPLFEEALATPDPWRSRVKTFANPANRYWNATDWGPPPGKPGCAAPQAYLTEFGFGAANVIPIGGRARAIEGKAFA